MSVELVHVLTESGKVPKTKLPKLDDAELLQLYEEMLRIRIFDKRMLAIQRQGRIGFYGPVKGQEAAIVASWKACDDEDWIVPALREGAISMLRGLEPRLAVAQLIGNGADLCKGRQMPCHYTWRAGKYIAMSSVIGTQISHATGIAMAAKYRKTDEVVLGFMGDGATSANDFHCGLNFAGVYKAPVVFICQNNQWSISVPFEQQTSSESIAVKARAYGIPGVRVDGNDVLATYQVIRDACERARSGKGPTLVEAVTYRQLGHSSSDDPTRYREQADVEAWLAKDPIERYRRFLVQHGLWDDVRDEALADRIDGEVGAVIREAEAQPALDPGTMITDVFAETDPRLEEHFREARG